MLTIIEICYKKPLFYLFFRQISNYQRQKVFKSVHIKNIFQIVYYQ